MAAHSPDAGSAWYALCVSTRKEVFTSNHLQAREIETLCPTYRVTRVYESKRIVANLPLFPSYVFARLDIGQQPVLRTVPGVLGIVGFSDGPIPVDPLEIAALRAVMLAGLLCEPIDFLRAGQRVRIKSGPFAGHEGVLKRIRGANRFVISVSLLQRSIAVEVPAELLEAA